MDICEFSRTLLTATTLKEGGLYDKSISSSDLKRILKSLKLDIPKSNDKKKLAKKIISYVQTTCVCINDVKSSKTFSINDL